MDPESVFHAEKYLTPGTNTFGNSYIDFDQNVLAPFHKFLRDVYCEYIALWC
jgi:hypothetical protein